MVKNENMNQFFLAKNKNEDSDLGWAADLGSRPSPYVRVLIALGWANRSYSTSRAPRGAGVAHYFGFFDSLFLADSGGEEQDDWLLG